MASIDSSFSLTDKHILQWKESYCKFLLDSCKFGIVTKKSLGQK
jgi:hypothetical protein